METILDHKTVTHEGKSIEFKDRWEAKRYVISLGVDWINVRKTKKGIPPKTILIKAKK